MPRACTLCVNGEFVGYGTDIRLPSEYDVSAYVRNGDNEVAVVVVKFSAHSYIEDQDQWWMGGLHRPVWIESRPPTRLADIPITTSFDSATRDGRVSVSSTVSFDRAAEAGWSVRTTLTDPSGKPVGRPQLGSVPHEHARPYEFDGFVVGAEFELRRARPWSAESPDRYAVTVELLDPRERVFSTRLSQPGPDPRASGSCRGCGKRGPLVHERHPTTPVYSAATCA